MPFKTKAKVKKQSNLINRVTLDKKHKEKIQQFTEQNQELNEINKKISQLELKIITFKSNNLLTEEELEEKLEIKDNIELYKNKLKTFDKNDTINYFLDTGNILFQYYDRNNNNEKKNTISVMDFFKKKKNNNPKSSKLDIYNNYLQKIEDNEFKFINNNTNDICETCLIEKKLFLSEGKMICEKCGDETKILIDSDKPSFKDPPREICYFAYKRINHFNEWLAQFQAKESTDIPKEIYNEILFELKKERITDITKLTQKKLREILKKLKKNKYYEHIPHIINKLNGVPPPIMSYKVEEELRRMFKEIQIPFHKHCPKDRKNFLSYSYVLHKFVQLLELDEFISCFVLLKSREKLHQQDQIWKKICQELKWEFIPSI
jgi:hypothetical protein